MRMAHGVVALCLAVAARAHAGIPCTLGACDAPSSFALVGEVAGVPDSSVGRFCVTIRRFSNPVPGAQVVIDFSGAPDLSVCRSNAGSLDCPSGRLLAYTGADGVACFTVTGGARAGTPGSGRGTVRLYANGVLFSNASAVDGLVVAAYDLDGANGVGGNDLSLWLAEMGSGAYAQRDDYNGDGFVGGDDLSLLLQVMGSGGSSQSCATVCP